MDGPSGICPHCMRPLDVHVWAQNTQTGQWMPFCVDWSKDPPKPIGPKGK